MSVKVWAWEAVGTTSGTLWAKKKHDILGKP
jgi:hypothetical protein